MQNTGSAFFKRSAAGASILALASAGLVVTPAGAVSSSACTDIVADFTDADAEVLSNNVCQLTFFDDASGVEIPDWVTKLSVVLVGGGGGANSVRNLDSNGTVGEGGTYGGGAGQTISQDDLDLTDRTLDIVVGAAGTKATALGNATAGTDTEILASSASPSSLLIEAKGGDAGNDFADSSGNAYSYSPFGSDSSGRNGSDDGSPYNGGGGGTASSASGLVGGSGISIIDVRDFDIEQNWRYLDPVLWAEDSAVLGTFSLLTFDFGEGGTIYVDPNDSVDAVVGSGRGGSADVEGANFAEAGDGIVIMRFAILEAYLDADTPSSPAPYTGPVLSSFSTRTLDPCIATAVTITGSNLLGAKPTIQGKDVTVLENTDTKLVLAFPAGLEAAQGEDLIVVSSSGTLRFQNAFDISSDTCATELSKGRWTQLQSDGKTVKMYAKDPIGDGKIQFFVDGEELAWINAIDESDPKLSFASGNPYLVRSVELNPGKNRFEIKLDGVRVWRATYVPKG